MWVAIVFSTRGAQNSSLRFLHISFWIIKTECIFQKSILWFVVLFLASCCHTLACLLFFDLPALYQSFFLLFLISCLKYSCISRLSDLPFPLLHRLLLAILPLPSPFFLVAFAFQLFCFRSFALSVSSCCACIRSRMNGVNRFFAFFVILLKVDFKSWRLLWMHVSLSNQISNGFCCASQWSCEHNLLHLRWLPLMIGSGSIWGTLQSLGRRPLILVCWCSRDGKARSYNGKQTP